MSVQNILRIPLKAVLLPVRLVLDIFTGAMSFILQSMIITKVFALASLIMLLAFLALTWSAIFISTDMSLIARILIPCIALLASYLLHPYYGVLKCFGYLIERIEAFNSFLKI